jgi:hypothetical protein
VEAKALNDKLDKLLADREVAQQNQVLWLKWQNATALELHPTLWERYMRISFESLNILVNKTKELNSGVTQAPPSIPTQPSLAPRTPSQTRQALQNVYVPQQYASHYAGQQQIPQYLQMPVPQHPQPWILPQPATSQPLLLVQQQQQPALPPVMLQQQQQQPALPPVMLQQQQQQQGPPRLVAEQSYSSLLNDSMGSGTQQPVDLGDVSTISMMSDINTSQLSGSMDLSRLFREVTTDNTGDNDVQENGDKDKDVNKDKDKDGL